jgi:hypothetical protein
MEGELNKCDGRGSVTVWGRCGGGVSMHGTFRWVLSTNTNRNYRGWRHWCERISILSNKFFFFVVFFFFLFFFFTRYAKEPFMYQFNLSILLFPHAVSTKLDLLIFETPFPPPPPQILYICTVSPPIHNHIWICYLEVFILSSIA